MKNRFPCLLLFSMLVITISCTSNPRSTSMDKSNSNSTNKSTKPNLTNFPVLEISNEQVSMKVYLPDTDKGLYRGTRFDWSGVIGSVQYKEHEYFGYWKKTHDPMFHEDLTGPVEGFIEPGLGYAEAEPGQGFIRIGVGVLEKEVEEQYNWMKTYNVLDFGKWTIDHGKDWVTFTHALQSDFGYAYEYTKSIRLKADGFSIEHTLRNLGERTIETDQFNHNFFMIDGERSGISFSVSFPYAISTHNDLKGFLEIENNKLQFVKDIHNNSVFVELEGYSDEVADNQATVLNSKSGAGVTFSVDKPLYRMVFWACETTLCPENFIWISVAPQEEDSWTSEYTLFVK